MKIVQVIASVFFGDAVGNDARAVCKVISEMGYETGIYTYDIDPRVKDSFVHPMSKLPKLEDDDIVIFNHCSGTDLCYELPKLGGRKMMIYHNITPAHFFDGYSHETVSSINKGYDGTRYLSDKIEYVMPVSRYNASGLRELGYTCPMYVRPIVIPFEDYTKEPDSDVIAKYGNDGYTNILFLGRIVPNKRQEDVITAFAYYSKHIDPRSRLILVGSDGGVEKYGACLKKYVRALGLDNVIFTGQTSFRAILAYYSIADVFLCMSEHEGFCVPLVESMFFKLPIIAYDSSAIAETLGGSGILLREKDPVLTARTVQRLVNDSELRSQIVEKQSARLKAFSYEAMKVNLEKGLELFINGKYKELPAL